MGRPINVVVDPFDDLAESATTSNILDVRDAFDHAISWRTNSGTTSVNTLQMSIVTHTVDEKSNIPEAAWSDWTTFGSSRLSRTINPPLGMSYMRILRENSGASFIVRSNKVVETS